MKILFIDDEKFFARPYIEGLRRDYDVLFCDSAEEGLALVKESRDFTLVVLDIMMPTPSGIAATATGNSFNTGLWLLAQVSEEIISRPLPVMILTNRQLTIVRERIAELGFPDDLITAYAKSDMPAFMLPEKVRLMLTRHGLC